ncbi:GDP-6-deoxy-D-mannose reductase [Sphingomonas antarctica]|uniref:NAD-dependent epimerase/dehydratase family protein n=1 Tax=Sphingomonas antarctica TaxID=2040274 RepID=UPI0039EC2619
MTPAGGPRSLLVIGGTGFFGKSILDAFRRGLLAPWGISRVIVAARNPDHFRSAHPELVSEAVEFATLDITKATELPSADFIIHAANTSDARRYAQDPLAERATIIDAAANFARLAARANRHVRIVYTSSGAVYGQQPAAIERIDEDYRPVDLCELAPYKRDYAEAKALAEREIARLGDQGLNVSVARCFAFVGRYLPLDQHFAVGNFLANGMAGREVVVNADREVIRSYLYADDLVEWLTTIAAAASPACPIYNVGSDHAIAVDDVAARIAHLYDTTVRLAPRKNLLADRYVPSVDRARHQLGLAIRYDIDAALAATARQLGDCQLVAKDISGRSSDLSKWAIQR